MEALFSTQFARQYQKAPIRVQRAFDKQLAHLLRDPVHPSLRSKKYDEPLGIFQARVDGSWRFYFMIVKNECHLLSIKSHPK